MIFQRKQRKRVIITLHDNAKFELNILHSKLKTLKSAAKKKEEVGGGGEKISENAGSKIRIKYKSYECRHCHHYRVQQEELREGEHK